MQKVKHDAGVRFSVTRTTEINIGLDGLIGLVNQPLYAKDELDEDKSLIQMSSNLMSLLDTRHIVTSLLKPQNLLLKNLLSFWETFVKKTRIT